MANSEDGSSGLKVSGLSKRYGSVQALDHVEIEVKAGEIVALLGENGAGKSTLVKILSGLTTPDEGTITLNGRPVTFRTSQQSQAAGVAVVQQEYSLAPNLTVAENVYLGQAASPLFWSKVSRAKAARPLLDRVGLDYVDPLRELRSLTVAERQLVEIARVLVRDAQLLIFDEPTASLSDAEITKVLGVIRSFAAEGRCVIYVTHRLHEVFEIGDRVVVFRDGHSLASVRVADVDAGELVSMIVGRKIKNVFPDRAAKLGAPWLEVKGLLTTGLEEPVSFSLREGEILGLTGQMGGGAGFVVQALAGHRPTLAGEVRIDGEVVRLRDRRAGIAAGIGYCSSDRQLDGMFPGLSVERNLTSAVLKDVSHRGVMSRAKEKELAKVAAKDLAIDAKRLPSLAGVLSGGNQQKIALGRWASGASRLLLIEDPTRGVDVGARSEIYRRLRAMCEAGMSIIVASSDTSEIQGFSDTIASFYRGRLTALMAHDEWSDESLLSAAMSGAIAARA